MNDNLNAQRYRDKILRPIVMPLMCRHYLMFQHDNAQPHALRICIEFLEAENVPVLPWPAYSPNTRHVTHWACLGCWWFDVYGNVFQIPPISRNFAQPLKRSGTTFHRPDQLYATEMCRAAWGKWGSTPLPFVKVSVTNRCISVFPVL